MAVETQVLSGLPSLFWVGALQERVMDFVVGVAVEEAALEVLLLDVGGAMLEVIVLELGAVEAAEPVLSELHALSPALMSSAANATHMI
ncbi:MAG: hypothetical protein KGO22_06095 [Gammaproteobacteria bacterium]|nr:hypothetical protein [Gammaproteobacteria bacterium]